MYQDIIQKQPMMRKVIGTLIPLWVFALVLYGFHLLWLSLIVFVFGFLAEYIMEKRSNKKVTEAMWVTCLLFILSLPPLTPWWVAAIGIVFALIFGKAVFGGFGRNVFNPAITGRLFIYIAFPNIMTQAWVAPLSGWNLSQLFQKADAVSTATPLGMLRAGTNVDIFELLLGWRSGSMGEGMIILIFLAAVYLIWTNTANWRLMVSTLLSGAALTFALQFFGVPQALDTIPALLSGSFLFVTVFMVTDPVSGPKNESARWIYGILIGFSAVIIRTFSLFPEGTSFAVLIGNTFAPLLDDLFSKVKTKKA